MVKFFARWCAPCAQTLPSLAQFHVDHPEIFVVGVSLDSTRAEAEEQVRLHRLVFPVLWDRHQVLRGRFRVTELPWSVVADRAGVVRWVGGPEQPPDATERAALVVHGGT